MRNCIVCDMGSGELTTLFSFPRNEILKNQWIAFCKIESEDFKINHRLCSLHFDPSAFKISVAKTGRRLKLRPEAVPTIFDTGGKSLPGPNQNNKKEKNDLESKNRKVYLCCCLCGVLDSKIPRFSFPIKYPELTAKWLNICGFKKEDLNINLHKVCIKHFGNDDFLERTTANQRLLLKPGAVPSVISNQLENTILGNENLEEPCFSGSLIISSDIPNNQTEVGSTINLIDDCADIDTTENTENQKLSETKVSLPSKLNTPSSTLKRKFPRYLKDINTPHCGRSRKAKMILDVARKDLARCRQSRNIFKQRNLQLKKKLHHERNIEKANKLEFCIRGVTL